MSNPTNLIVGPQLAGDGSVVGSRAGRLGDQIISELHGKYYEQCYRGNLFMAASQAVATTTVGLATTYTGMCISNPLGSGRNLALLQASMMQSVIQATQIEAYAIATGSSPSTNVTHTTPATVQSALVGSSYASIAKADIAATLPVAPVYSAFITNTAAATQNSPTGFVDFGGSIILAPGAYALFVTPAQASVAGLWFSFLWEEVQI